MTTTEQPGTAEVGPVGDAPQKSIGDRIRALLAGGEKEKKPLYPRVLRLKNVHPNGWQRAVLVEGMAVAGGIAALADLATAWTPLILPVGAAIVVKFHDVLAGVLPTRPGQSNGGATPTTGGAAGSSEMES